MKTNVILLFLLVVQCLALLWGGEQSDQSNEFSKISQKLSPDSALALGSNGSDLQRWLDQRSLKLEEAVSALGIETERLETALKSSKLNESLINELNLSGALKNLVTFSLSEGKDEESLKESKVLEISKSETGWRATSDFSYPADQIKVETILKKLLDLDLKTVIARRSENFAKLRVSDLVYDRRLELKPRDGNPIVIYIGQGKSGAVHLRLGGDQKVYRVSGLSLWSDLNTSVTRLIDTQYFDVKDAQSVKISGPGERLLELKRIAESWTVQGINESELDQDKAKRFVDAAKTLILTEVVSDKAQEQFASLKSEISVTVSSDKETKTYRLGEVENDRFLANTSENPFVVAVASYKVKALLTQTLEDFLTEGAKEARQKAASAQLAPPVPDEHTPSVMPSPPAELIPSTITPSVSTDPSLPPKVE